MLNSGKVAKGRYQAGGSLAMVFIKDQFGDQCCFPYQCGHKRSASDDEYCQWHTVGMHH